MERVERTTKEVIEMEITIKGESKEIADLVLEIQDRRDVLEPLERRIHELESDINYLQYGPGRDAQ